MLDGAPQHRQGEGGATEAGDVERLDLRGLRCPLPALRLAKHLGARPAGTLVWVLADDPLAPLDIAHLCARRGDGILAQERSAEGASRFLIRSRSG